MLLFFCLKKKIFKNIFILKVEISFFKREEMKWNNYKKHMDLYIVIQIIL